MSGTNPFPNVRDKLSAPSKKSAFEKARLEAEEKRKREEAETAAVYKDFVASFDEGPPEAPSAYGHPSGRGGYGAQRGGFRGPPPSGPGRRHFSGPPGRGGLSGPPPPRKRGSGNAFEGDEEEGGVFGALSDREKRRMKDNNTGLLAYENSGPKRRGEKYGEDSDSDTAAPHPKPTVALGSLPPNITKQQLTDLLSSTPLKVDSIRIIPAPPPSGPSQPSSSTRKAATALVTLSPETPSSDIDAAVSALNGRYMGYGFWLTIVRHLSSTVAGAAPGIPNVNNSSNPFGAKALRPVGPAGSMGRGGPHRGGFAPPPNFAPPGRSHAPLQGRFQVHVQPPQNLKVLRLIHRTIESLLTHGPELEALLMSKDEVRMDPKFAWLWDARSPAGVYYRWKLWEIVTGFAIDKPYTPTVDIFEAALPGGNAVWIPPKKPLKYEWAGSLKDVVEDYDFMSDELDEDDSDQEDNDDDRPVGLAGGEGKKARGYLGVLERAKLVHLVARVPTQSTKVRRGDVGRVMAFAMEHAEGGMGEEVVDILVSNVLRPLAYTKATRMDNDSDTEGSDVESGKREEAQGKPDTSSAKVVGLWLISDVLSNSSLGVRAAWRYRQLFDNTLRERKVFEHLGEIYRESGWGRMKAEKFRRMVVEGVLEGWEKWCIFPQATYDAFLNAFLEAPTTSERAKSKGPESDAIAVSHTPPPAATKSRWKTVDAEPSVFDPAAATVQAEDEDIDGVPLADDEDIDGEPLMDDDLDGEPMPEDEDRDPMEDDDPVPEEEDAENAEKREEMVEEEKKPAGFGFGGVAGFRMGTGTAKRKRPKAEDMFADDFE